MHGRLASSRPVWPSEARIITASVMPPMAPMPSKVQTDQLAGKHVPAPQAKGHKPAGMKA
jgi:hypothetical protein